jgi:GT2 family glycosyltransferase
MDLSIIIINWNSADYVRKCLSTLYGNDRGADYETIVVDNASFDSCREMIQDIFRNVIFLQSNENLGFAKANNFGAERAQGEYLLFLNPDTEIVNKAVAAMLSVIKCQPQAGVIGCKLLNTDMTLQTSCVQFFPTVMNQVLDSNILHRLFPGLSVWSVETLLLDDTGPVEVQVISGACMMVRKSVFEEVGGFSPEYFMYTEDIDLCYKVRHAGYKNYYTGAASVIHHGGKSSHSREESSYAHVQMRESISKFLKKTRGGLYAFLYRSSMLLSGMTRLCMITLAYIPFTVTGQGSICSASFKKWTGVVRWSLGIERWAR